MRRGDTAKHLPYLNANFPMLTHYKYKRGRK